MNVETTRTRTARGGLEPRHVVMPLRQMCPHAELILGSAVSLDEEARVVRVRTDTGLVEVRYERLVVAAGSATRVLPIPGLAEHGVGFKTIEEAVHLRNVILHRLDQADAAADADRARYLTFVFVGGGYAGVEAASQLRELVQHALRFYPRLRDVPQRWLLVDGGPRILASIPGRPGEYATTRLTRAGIEVHSGTHLVSAEDGHVVLSTGAELDAETLVWCAGVQPSPLGARLGLPVDERGRILVDETLTVMGRPRIHALGDAARVPNAATPGRYDPPTCQHALHQARRLARNLGRQAAGREHRPYRYRTRGQMAIIGRRQAVCEAFGVPLSGLLAWGLTRAYHLAQLPLRRRRIRVCADWFVASIAPWDISQLGSLGHAQPVAPAASAPVLVRSHP